MIELINIEKVYKTKLAKVEVLKGVNLTIKEGEKLAIVGKSGSGKSTLLNIIGLMDTYNGGEYILDGTEINKLGKYKREQIRKKYMSFIFQNYALLPHSTMYENIEVPLIAAGLKRSERKEKIQEVMERLGVQDLRNNYPSQLSGGQQQKCAIARTLVSDCKIILADEPTGAIDEAGSWQIIDIIKKIKDKTVILATHDMEVANSMDRSISVDGAVCIREEKN